MVKDVNVVTGKTQALKVLTFFFLFNLACYRLLTEHRVYIAIASLFLAFFVQSPLLLIVVPLILNDQLLYETTNFGRK